MSKKILLFALAVLLAPVVQATPIQISSGTDPIAVEMNDSVCVFASNPLLMTCVDQTTGKPGNTITLDPSLVNIDGQKIDDKAVIGGENGDDLKVFIVGKTGQGINFPISIPGKQSNPKISFNPDDKQIGVVWQDKRDGIQSDIYFQIYDLTGNPSYPEVRVSNTSQDETNPNIVYDPDSSKYIVVYHNETDSNLYFKEFEKTGIPVVTTDEIVSTEPGTRNFPEAAERKGNDLIYVLYEDTRQGLGKDIFLTRIKGGVTIPSDKTISTSVLDENLPDVAYNTLINELGIIFQEGSSISFASFDISLAVLHNSKKNVAIGTNPSIAYLNKAGLYFVAYQNRNNIQGVFLKEDGTESAPHKLVALPSGFEVFDLNGNKLNVGFESFSNTPVLIKHPTLGLASGATLRLQDTDIDLSTAEVKISGEGSVYLDFSSVIGLTNPIAYLQNTNSGAGFLICPEAKSLNETFDGCPAQKTIKPLSLTIINQNRIESNTVTINGKSYYEIKGLAVGGFSLSSQEAVKLDLFDETKFVQRLPNQIVKFFAFYTENNIPISTGKCDIEFNTDPTGEPKKSAMSFDQQSNLYLKSAKFPIEGNFVFTIICTGGGKNATANSTYKIGNQKIANDPPVITTLEPSGGEVDQVTTSLKCSATDDKGLQEIRILLGSFGGLQEVKKESFYRQEKTGAAEFSATTEQENKWQCIAKDINGNETESAVVEFKLKKQGTRVCQEDWGCGSWSGDACGTRTCTDKNNCRTEKNKPITQIDCPKPPEKGFDISSLLLPLMIIVIILIAILGGYSFWKNRKSTEEPNSTNDENI